MQLRCRSCDAPIPAKNMNLEHRIAKCDACQAVFNFTDELGSAPKRQLVTQPKNMTLIEDPYRFTLVRRWLSPATFFMLFFCLFWDGFLVVWYGAAFSGATQNNSGAGFEWVMVLFPLGHVAVGVGLTYFVIASFLNTTKISVDENTLSVRHSPIPWPGNKELPTLDIDQVFCQKSSVTKNNQSIYLVKLLMKEGKKIKLLGGINNKNHALFIEQKIENILGLEDQPVSGELSR